MRKMMIALCVGALLLVTTFGAFAQTNNDAWIPGLGSFVIPGLGQLLNDQMDKAIIHFGVSVAVWTLGFYGRMFFPPLAYATPALALGWHIFSGLDAYNTAKDQGFRIGLVDDGIGFAFSF